MLCLIISEVLLVKNIGVFSLVFFIMIGCNNKKPESLITKKDMVAILIDLHMAEAKVNSLSLSSDSAHGLFKVFEKQLYDKYQVTDSIYLKSFNYYLNELDAMDDIYTSVVDTLIRRQKMIDPSISERARFN
jgi:hypothetical protein